MPRPERLAAATYLTLILLASSLRADETLTVLGLSEPVEILRDRWGIAHIYARNESDLFFAQGYNVARDRLFQLELWRRQATGTMAEIQGPRSLAGDRGARLLRYRGDMADELGRYHPRGASIIQSFVRGINAYIEATEREPSLLPFEFTAVNLKPGRWTAEVVVSRHNGLFRNATQEIQAARLVHVLGPDRARDLLNLHPGRPSLTADPVVDLASLNDVTLASYRASRSTFRFRPEDIVPEYRGKPSTEDKPAEKTGAAGIETRGSNNWVLAASRTEMNAPIMANDPHRTIDLPSLRYWVHLVAPGWDVIGGGEPALPGVSIGHNSRGAWGFTIFPIDQEDLYVYDTDRDDPSRYRYGDGWETMRAERESVPVKGGANVAVELKFTRHGPVLHEDPVKHKAYALRAAWLEPGSAPYLASLRIDQAANWAEFRNAASYFRTPSENLVWADRDGQIGWQAVGSTPLRKGWDGVLPVAGDGRFEWAGFLPPGELPYELNPPRGWFASANQDNLPPRYPTVVGYQWAEPFRFKRLVEFFEPDRRIGIAELTRLQQDELLLPARALVPLVTRLKPTSEKSRKALERLAVWDFVMGRDSIAAAIYATWEKAVKAAVGERIIPTEAREILAPRQIPLEPMIRLLAEPGSDFGPNPVAGRDALLLGALDRTVDELTKRLGPDLDRWQYGQAAFKHATLRHPLSDSVNAETRARIDVGPLPRGGSAHTVNSTSDADNQATGASFRVIADTGDWDRSLGTNTPGQSGDPNSPHYRDLFAPWASGAYFPVAYTRPKVESVSEAKMTLSPPDATAAVTTQIPDSPAALDRLQTNIERITRGVNARWGVYIKCLETGDEIAIGADEAMDTMSTIKIPLMVEAYRQIEAGKFKLDDRYTLKAEDKRPGTGIIRTLDPGAVLSIKDLLTLMTTVSDNSATDILFNKVGGIDPVNALMDQYGLKSIRATGPCDRWFKALREAGDSTRFHKDAKTPFGLSSAREMGHLLEKIAKGEAVSPKASEAMLAILREQVYRSRIPRYVTGYRIPHKTGDFLPFIGNDVGLLESPRHKIVIVVFTAQHYGLGSNLEDAIGRLAEQVGDYYATH